MVFRTPQQRIISPALIVGLLGLCLMAPQAALAQQGDPPPTDGAEQAPSGPVAPDEADQADAAEADTDADGEAVSADAEEEQNTNKADNKRTAPEGMDPKVFEAMEAFNEAHERYAREMKDYQDTVDSIVESEYSQRAAQINAAYERRIKALEAVERSRRIEAIAAFEEYLRRYPNTPGYTPDALFRLAELHFEKANDDYMQADDKFQQQQQLYTQGKRPEPPKVPRRDYSTTVDHFEQLVTDWPDYEQADGAFYLLAYCKLQMNEEDRARELLASLVESYPDSRFVPEAWVRIGEHWFAYAEGPEDLAKAKDAYEQAMQYPDSKFYDKALYKLAWTYYRMDDFEQAIGEFKRLVAYSDEQERKTGRSGSVLREESVQYIAVSLAEEDWDLDGAVDEDFGLERIKHHLTGEEPYEREVLVQLTDYLFENTRYTIAADVIHHALDRYPRHRDNPKLHEKLILALMRDGRQDESFAERRNMLAFYGPESEWYEFQQRAGHEEAVRYANNLVKDNLIQSATWFHEEAQKLKNEAVVREDQQMLALAREKYARASSAYEDFLARYPNDKDVYQWNFYYAECLYYSEQYEVAFEQYRVVRELDVADNKFQEKAAFNAVKALEFRMRAMANRGDLPSKAVPGSGVDDAREAAQQQEEVETSADEVAERDDSKRVIQTEEIPDMVYGYVTSMDRYVVLDLENPTDPELDLKFAFQAAKLFYDFKDYDVARERFAWIVDNHPESELAYLAGSLILETYRQERDYQKLAMWADKLSEVIKGDQADAIKEEVRQFKLGAMFKSAEQLFADKKYEPAAEEYLKLVNDSPDHQYAPKALNNAAVAYENIGKYESAMNLYERVYNEYTRDPLSGYALYRVAVNSERFFDFDKAVRSYMLFYDKFETEDPPELAEMGFNIDEKRSNALRSAAVLTENLQRYEEAARLYEKYVRNYSEADDAEGAQWRAVNAWQKADQPREMMRAIENYRSDFGANPEKSARVLEAMMMVADHYESRGDDAKAKRWYEDIVEEYTERAPEEDGGAAFYAAKARFQLADYSYYEWSEIKIKGNMKQQGKLLKKKIEGQKALTKEFQEVWQFGSLEWTLAATFRIGSLFQTFAAALYEVPIPFDDDSEEWMIYRGKLDDIAYPLEDKAMEYYEQTIKKAREEKVVNEWTKKTLEELNAYMPDKYPLYKEERREVAKTTVTGSSFMGADSYEERLKEPAGADFEADEAPAVEQEGEVEQQGEVEQGDDS